MDRNALDWLFSTAFLSRKGVGILRAVCQTIFDNRLSKIEQSYILDVNGGWFQYYSFELSHVKYNRNLYTSIAVLMFPFFLENPNLWKMIVNIGSIRHWQSLEELLSHLQSKADSSYDYSLYKMMKMFK